MDNKQRILVTGGTGNQGGAIARNLHKLDIWRVQVLSRNPKSEKSLQLLKEGIEVLKGDLNNPETYRDYLTGVYGVFSVQDYANGVEKEIDQGIKLAKTSVEQNVQHFLYSSVSGADLKSGIPHFDSKYEIEKYIINSELPFTIIRPTSFYENLLNPEVKKRILKGKLVMPLNKEVVQEFISVNDIGIIGTQIFSNPSKYLKKTLTIASDKMSMIDLTDKLSQGLGTNMKYEKLPKLISRLVMGKNLYIMFNWINKNRPEFINDLDSIKSEFEGLSNMETWLKENF